LKKIYSLGVADPVIPVFKQNIRLEIFPDCIKKLDNVLGHSAKVKFNDIIKKLEKLFSRWNYLVANSPHEQFKLISNDLPTVGCCVDLYFERLCCEPGRVCHVIQFLGILFSL